MSAFQQMAQDFLAQKHIAVAGVSRTGSATGNGIYDAFKQRGYTVYAINPNADTIGGDPCYASVGDVPAKLDGIVIVTRPELATEIARDCVAAGVPRVWMHNNTFAPSSVSDEAEALCRENGIAVISGGCPMMFFDFGHKCMRAILGMMGRLPA